MNSVIKKIYADKFIKDEKGNTITGIFPISIPYKVGLVLYNFIRKNKIKNTCETGMACGVSTLFICQALYDNGKGRHIAMDPFQSTRFRSVGLLNIKRAKLSRFLKFYCSPSHEILPKLANKGIGFVFIDGNHLFDYTIVDFFCSDKIINPGGYIMFHDTWMPSVRKVLNFVLRNYNYKIIQGYATWPEHNTKKQLNYCILKKINNDKRGWDHYRNF